MNVHTYTHTISDPTAQEYRVRAEGERQADGKWWGWLVFERTGSPAILRTERETTQGNWEDLEYWATGLETVYLEGALARAKPI